MKLIFPPCFKGIVPDSSVLNKLSETPMTTYRGYKITKFFSTYYIEKDKTAIGSALSIDQCKRIIDQLLD